MYFLRYLNKCRPPALPCVFTYLHNMWNASYRNKAFWWGPKKRFLRKVYNPTELKAFLCLLSKFLGSKADSQTHWIYCKASLMLSHAISKAKFGPLSRAWLSQKSLENWARQNACDTSCHSENVAPLFWACASPFELVWVRKRLTERWKVSC